MISASAASRLKFAPWYAPAKYKKGQAVLYKSTRDVPAEIVSVSWKPQGGWQYLLDNSEQIDEAVISKGIAPQYNVGQHVFYTRSGHREGFGAKVVRVILGRQGGWQYLLDNCQLVTEQRVKSVIPHPTYEVGERVMFYEDAPDKLEYTKGIIRSAKLHNAHIFNNYYYDVDVTIDGVVKQVVNVFGNDVTAQKGEKPNPTAKLKVGSSVYLIQRTKQPKQETIAVVISIEYDVPEEHAGGGSNQWMYYLDAGHSTPVKKPEVEVFFPSGAPSNAYKRRSAGNFYAARRSFVDAGSGAPIADEDATP